MKIPLNCQFADLLVQLSNPLPAVTVRRSTAESVRQMLECLVLPARHLVRVDLVVRRNLGNRLLTPNRLQGHPCLERC